MQDIFTWAFNYTDFFFFFLRSITHPQLTKAKMTSQKEKHVCEWLEVSQDLLRSRTTILTSPPWSRGKAWSRTSDNLWQWIARPSIIARYTRLMLHEMCILDGNWPHWRVHPPSNSPYFSSCWVSSHLPHQVRLIGQPLNHSAGSMNYLLDYIFIEVYKARQTINLILSIVF